MRRFEFSLDRVLTLRKQQQRLAELKLSRRSAAVAKARDAHETLVATLNKLGDSLQADLQNRTPSAFDVNPFTYRLHLRNQLELARNQLDEARCQYQESLAEHVALTQKVEIFATLRSNRKMEHDQQQQKLEQQQIDALVAARWAASR